ncbi:MAG: hypothetical protein SOS98_05200 [Varibaculum sp.]|nr:hypothetical protein [Varibaculum sp.]
MSSPSATHTNLLTKISRLAQPYSILGILTLACFQVAAIGFA